MLCDSLSRRRALPSHKPSAHHKIAPNRRHASMMECVRPTRPTARPQRRKLMRVKLLLMAATLLAAWPVHAQERPPSAPPPAASPAKPEAPAPAAAPQAADTLPVSIARVREKLKEKPPTIVGAAPQGGLFDPDRGAASVAGDVLCAALGDVAARPGAHLRAPGGELSAFHQLRVSGGVRRRSRESDRVGEAGVQWTSGAG